MAPRRNPWDRKPGENSKRYEAFTTYLTMDDRSLHRVAKKLGKSTTIIQRWSYQDGWVKRAEAYDEYVIREYLKEEKRRRVKALRSQAQLINAGKQRLALSVNTFTIVTAQDWARLFDAVSKAEREVLRVDRIGEDLPENSTGVGVDLENMDARETRDLLEAARRELNTRLDQTTPEYDPDGPETNIEKPSEKDPPEPKANRSQ